MSNQYRNILVHSLVNLGDVVLSTSAAALLKRVYPQAKITMMVKPAAAEIVKNNPAIDDVLIFSYKEKKKSWRDMWHFVKEVRSRKFDLSISLDRKLRPALITWLAGIPSRVGPDRVFDNKPSRVTKLFTHTIHTPDDFMNTHQSEIFQSIIRGFCNCQGTALPVIGRITAQHREKAQQLIGSLPKAEKKIALCVKGTYYLKNWPQKNFVEFIRRLAAKYDSAFFIVGAPEDREYAQQVIDGCSVPVANFCGQTGLLELAALLDKSDLFVTIDTGGMHIAATTSVPIVGLFRCVSTSRWRPLCNRGQAIEKKLPGCPAVKNPEDCPMNDCVKEIKVEDVLSASINKLNVSNL